MYFDYFWSVFGIFLEFKYNVCYYDEFVSFLYDEFG